MPRLQEATRPEQVKAQPDGCLEPLQKVIRRVAHRGGQQVARTRQVVWLERLEGRVAREIASQEVEDVQKRGEGRSALAMPRDGLYDVRQVGEDPKADNAAIGRDYVKPDR